MGRYDDIDPAALRTHLVRLARLILELDRDGSLLREAPRLQKVLGDLRQRLFAYEVRGTADLEATDAGDGDPESEDEDSLVEESLRIVQEALEREEELRDELGDSHPEEEDDDDE